VTGFLRSLGRRSRALPPDSHVHSQWSWDAPAGGMEGACRRAADLGLPAIAFTEHADFTTWVSDPGKPVRDARLQESPVGADGRYETPPLDVTGYLKCLQRCREQFRGLRIISGVELGEAHWHPAQVSALLAGGDFDRVLGSLHSLDQDAPLMVDTDMFDPARPGELIRSYLAEALTMIESSAPFGVLAHIDYPMRYWPGRRSAPFAAPEFEEEYRVVLRALAGSGRALEINTVVPLAPEIVRWWHDVGGDAVTFGSDAHAPDYVARRFTRAAAIARASGFRPGKHPHDLWRRG
jgi:histidinol-phosphatase (PHP family)